MHGRWRQFSERDMNIKKYFETSEKEPRLIDIIAVFYIIQVLGYTSDDIKGNYPIALVIMGLIFHLTALLICLDDFKVRSYFGAQKRVVYKILPIGLTATYTASIASLIQNGEVEYSTHYNIATFMMTGLPMIMFYASVGFKVKSFDFLKQKKKGTNYLFIVFLVTILIGQKIINN